MNKQIIIDYNEYLILSKAKEILENATINNFHTSYTTDNTTKERIKHIICEELFDYLCENDNLSGNVKVIEIRK